MNLSMQPYFSVILPTHNRAAFIGSAVESILHQSFEDWEAVIVDDGSADDTAEVVKQYRNDARIKYIVQTNAGAGAARNTALTHAKGKYFAFLDDDDYFLPEHLDSFHRAISERGEPVAFFRSLVQWEENGQWVHKQAVPPDHGLSPAVQMLLKDGVGIYPTAAVLHREIFDEIRFNPHIRASIDAECWIRVLCRYPLITLPSHTSVVRRHSDNLTADKPITYRRYIKTWKEVLTYSEVKQHVPLKYLRELIARYYTFLTYTLQRQGQGWASIGAILAALRYDPSRFFQMETYKLLIKGLLHF